MNEHDTFDMVWRGIVVDEAAGLDLADAEDRAAYRQRFLRRTAHVRVDAMREFAAREGIALPGNSTRTETMFAIVNHHIAEVATRR